MPSSKPSDAVPVERLRLIVESYRRLTGKELLDTPPLPCRERTGERVDALNAFDSLSAPLRYNEAAFRLALWEAPRAIVAHGTEADPIFFYGNRLALELFGMSFEEFARLPSRLSAEPLAQEAREKLLERVTRQGYVDGYSGVRIARDGRRFTISDCTVWNLADATGGLHGQAAVFIPQP